LTINAATANNRSLLISYNLCRKGKLVIGAKNNKPRF
jgi:hypothetical protein